MLFFATRVLSVFAAGLFLLSCTETPVDPDACATHELLCKGRAELGTGDWKKALVSFTELGNDDDFTCDAEYGLLLTRMLEGITKLDALVETVGLFLDSGAPGFDQQSLRSHAEALQPAQFGDLNSLVENFLKPFEDSAAKVREKARSVLELDSCAFDLYEGLPIDIGQADSLLFFSATVGYQWDNSAARIILSGVNLFQVVVNLVLAHNLSIDDLTGPLDVILKELDALYIEDDELAENSTYISVLRSAGAALDRNPDLLAFATAANGRMDELDNLLMELYRALYDNTGTAERGFIPDMIIRSRDDSHPGDNVFGWVDNPPTGPGANDTLIVGLRKINLFSTVALTDNTGGIEVTFNQQFGDIDTAIAKIHDIIAILGNQVEAVDDQTIAYPSGDYRPIGFGEINDIIGAIELLQLFLDEIPEALELDFRSYFVGLDQKGPKAFRDLFPYWYDDDDCEIKELKQYSADCKSHQFMIEGESAVSGPSVITADSRHFAWMPTNATFVDGFEFGSLSDRDNGETTFVSGVSIPADGISAAQLGFTLPFPYIAWQDPSFNGIILVDETRLPVAAIAPEEAGAQDYKGDYFAPADQYTVNKALNAYITYFLDQDNPFSQLDLEF